MSLVENFTNSRVLCIGDVMVDRFIEGAVKRISPESPVPVFSVERMQIYPGGTANVARNIAALGGRCTLIGVIGGDELGRILVSDLAAAGSIIPVLVVNHDRPTTEKTRFVARGQHVLRVDQEVTTPIPTKVAEEVLALVTEQIDVHDVVVLSDYAKGVLTDGVIQGVIALARGKNLPVVVDPKSRNLARYRGATVITPNAKEIEAATGIDPLFSEDAAEAAAKLGMEQADCGAILLTLGEKGMTLVQRGGKPAHIESCAREVFDVVGAGDTVVATLSLALGAGSDLENASRIANVAAGIAVGRRGTSTVSQSDLVAELTKSDKIGHDYRVGKILSRAELNLRIQAWKRDGLRIGFTNGCFDILHLGHIRLLKFSRHHCDRLVVGINGDSSVRRLKGPHRPVNDAVDRAEVLAGIDAVDAVVVFEEDTPKDIIMMVEPDILVKGADYAIEEIVGADYVVKRGGKVLRFDLLPDRSSTNLINKMRKNSS